MRATHVVLVVAAIACGLVSVAPSFAQGRTTQYYIGPFQGEVVIKDAQTPGRPGYYYYPERTDYPTFSERYDHPVRCQACGHWRDLGRACAWCNTSAGRYEARQAQRGAIYAPRALPGQYWYDKPQRSLIPKVHLGYPYVNNRPY